MLDSVADRGDSESAAASHAGGLRAHGHAVIFASLFVKALHDAPHMARSSVIKALCGLGRQIAKHKPQKPVGSETSCAETQTMINALFDSLVRFQPLLGRPSIRRPNFTHMVTHTEALMNPEMMGYADLAKAGHPGHHAHLDAPVPEVDLTILPVEKSVSLETVMSKDYWADPKNQERWNDKFGIPNNPNGDWIASGHLSKVLYSYHRLIARVEDKEKVMQCSQILLERYLNPDVQGG